MREETGLAARPADLDLLSVVHGTHRGLHYNMITYVLDYAKAQGSPTPGEEATAVEFWTANRVLSSPDETRKIDREAVRSVFDT